MSIELGERLTKLRKEHGYSQEELGEKLGVSRQAISKWELGESSPDTDNLIALAKLYDCSIDYLLGFSKDEQSSSEDMSEEKKTNKTSINFDKGIHIKDDDGSIVDIDHSGIHVKDDEDEISITHGGVFVNGKNYSSNKKNKIRGIIDGLLFLLITTTYIVLGCVLQGTFGVYELNAWGFFWQLFLIFPIISSLLEAIIYKNANKFAYPVLIVAIYLFIGLFLGGWHPYWFIFLSIPVYYCVVKLIKHILER